MLEKVIYRYLRPLLFKKKSGTSNSFVPKKSVITSRHQSGYENEPFEQRPNLEVIVVRVIYSHLEFSL